MAAAPTKEEADVAEQDDSNTQSSMSDEKYRSSASSVGAAAKAECGEAVGGLRRDRFGCPITSKSKNHSLCFADEAPGANQEPLVCTVNVESFKQAHNRVNSEMHPEGDGRLGDTAVSSNDQVPPFSEEDDDDAKRMRAKTHSICFADEVPGGQGELAHVRYVESFKVLRTLPRFVYAGVWFSISVLLGMVASQLQCFTACVRNADHFPEDSVPVCRACPTGWVVVDTMWLAFNGLDVLLCTIGLIACERATRKARWSIRFHVTVGLSMFIWASIEASQSLGYCWVYLNLRMFTFSTQLPGFTAIFGAIFGLGSTLIFAFVPFFSFLYLGACIGWLAFGAVPSSGTENYGTILDAIWSTLQLSSADSWSTGLAKPIFGDVDGERSYFGLSIILFNFILVNSFVALMVEAIQYRSRRDAQHFGHMTTRRASSMLDVEFSTRASVDTTASQDPPDVMELLMAQSAAIRALTEEVASLRREVRKEASFVEPDVPRVRSSVI
ncbi:hypothetical protein FOZ61_000890 [Perkinsus olseni]|uniref:Ion transport domain-containing protein n=1 Tax=Perkinsus olseni TaxID=32597 RepID=A0A7J6LYQ2_PEROL|nr:hypothetical protein FOZ61_000890 [Perkinsus olseni]